MCMCDFLYYLFLSLCPTHIILATFVVLQVGNVYVQFREEEHASNALKNLTGRYYAGKNLLLLLLGNYTL